MEYLRERTPKTPVRAVLLDFDGTVSTLRYGWETVMKPLMLEMISGGEPWDAALEAYGRAMPLREKPRFVDCEESIAQIQEIRGDYAAAIRAHEQIIEIMREDWGFTEGEGVDVHRREIQRLRGRMNG